MVDISVCCIFNVTHVYVAAQKLRGRSVCTITDASLIHKICSFSYGLEYNVYYVLLLIAKTKCKYNILFIIFRLIK